MEFLSKLLQEHFESLSKEEILLMESYFEKEYLSKNDFFTHTGEVCNKLSFINFGILRVYTLMEDREITQWIATEKSMITEVTGFFFNKPNRWAIQAFTDVGLWTITKKDYLLLCDQIPSWNTIEKIFLLKCFSMMEDRIFTHLSMTAEERYDIYFSQQKELFNQIPLQYIASVLGMSAETLSRIRKRKVENS